MREQGSDWLVGIMMAFFGLLGLWMAAGARDDEIYVFGWSLTAFAVVFIGGLVRRHLDKHDHAVKAGRHV